MGFAHEPKHILLVGCGFLGKYLLTNILEGYEQYINASYQARKNELYAKGKKDIQLPLVTILDKSNQDQLFQFPLLQNFDKKGYERYQWGSMGDILTLQRKKLLENVDAIVNTAAIADVPYAIDNPFDTYQTNVMNTLNFMEYLRTIDYEGKIIHMSSESVLGHQEEDKLPFKESEIIPNPANVYGSSKLAQEQIVLTYAKSYGLNATVLRSATMYGPYGRTKQAIPIFIKQILDNKPVTLEGDGEQSRDFVYVEDTARAIELAIYTKENIKGEVINIGSGRETKFINLIRLIAQTIGMKWDLTKPGAPKIEFKDFRAGEKGLRVQLDITKAEKLLGYSPIYPMTGADSSGLKTTIEWVANYLLNYDENEMDSLRRIMYPMRYREVEPDNGPGLGDIQVSV